MDISILVAGVITTQLKELLTKLSKEFGEEVKQTLCNNILEYQVEEYNRNALSKTLLHRVTPKPLKDFYQPLFITKCNSRGDRRYFSGTTKRIATDSIEKLFDNGQFLTLIGNAGGGKSTIVKYLFLNAIDTNFRIPIKIELRYLNDFEGDIINYIKERVFKLNKLAEHDRIIERLMKSGDFVFFLDGYDEVSSIKKEKITKEIDDLVKLYNKNYYLLTTRPYTEIDLLPLFHNFEVCDLSDKDISQFIKKQIPKEEKELIDKIIEAINLPDNQSYKSFLSNPLLLSMFILTFQSYSSIPQKRSVFYAQVFDALFSVHDSMSKLAFVREKQSGLSKEQIIEVLELFSFLSYFEDKFIFTHLYLNGKFDLIKEKKPKISFENTKLINDLQVAIGVINQDGTEYTFPHRSLQEYFAAVYISSLSEQNKKIVYEKIIKLITSSRGRLSVIRSDNFHSLLSELDENGVIKHALVPYLTNFVKQEIDTMEWENIIEQFIALETLYSSFYPIIKCDDLIHQNHEYTKIFRKYMPEKKGKKLLVKDREKQSEIAREQLAINHIAPFLKEYMSDIQKKIKTLSSELAKRDASDSDIISLI